MIAAKLTIETNNSWWGKRFREFYENHHLC